MLLSPCALPVLCVVRGERKGTERPCVCELGGRLLTHAKVHTYGDQRSRCESQFSPSTMWVFGIKLRPLDLEANTFTNQAILSTYFKLQQ